MPLELSALYVPNVVQLVVIQPVVPLVKLDINQLTILFVIHVLMDIMIIVEPVIYAVQNVHFVHLQTIIVQDVNKAVA
jgi:hypothetical protein